MRRAIVVFVVVACALSIALSLVVGLTGGHASPLIGLRVLSMIIPALAVLIVQTTLGEGTPIDWNRFPVKYLPVALFLIPVVMHASMLPTIAALEGRLPWESWLTPQADGLYHTPASRGWGVLTTQGLVARIAINAIVGLIVVSILAFFEEVGWRGWLLPRLVDRMGVRRAIIVTAIVWGCWHVPFALSGIQHIEGASPIRLAAGIPLGVFSVGLVIGWLWVRTASIWIVALAHGALNSWGQYAFKYMGDGPITLNDTIVAGMGTLGMLALGVALLAFGLPSAKTTLALSRVSAR